MSVTLRRLLIKQKLTCSKAIVSGGNPLVWRVALVVLVVDENRRTAINSRKLLSWFMNDEFRLRLVVFRVVLIDCFGKSLAGKREFDR